MLKIAVLTTAERLYAYKQSRQIEGQTGFIGYLRGDFGSGNDFYTSWFEKFSSLKTEEFKKELDTVINFLRRDNGLLQNRKNMTAFVKEHPTSAFQGNYCTEYGFRVDMDKHAFLLRCNPTKGDYNFYCYCYVKEWLCRHMTKAKLGIRFIDSQYNELFRIPDGEKIVVCGSLGTKKTHVCRFIDEYHTEIGNTIFHICEFAELLEQNGNSVVPFSEDES